MIETWELLRNAPGGFCVGKKKYGVKNKVYSCFKLKCGKMPIQVKDYVWEETDETVLITVPLKGVPSNRVDIFSIDDYIKVSYTVKTSV